MRTVVILCLTAAAVSLCNAQWVHTNGPYDGAFWNLAVCGTHLFAATGSEVFHSTNDGASWAAANTPFGDFSNIVQIGSNLFAGTFATGVWSSTNNGASWTQVNTGITDTVVRALVVSGTNLFAGTADNGVFRSTDNGSNWTHVDSGLPNTSVWSIVVNGTNLFASTGAGVFLSTNSGMNWSQTDSAMQVGKLRASGTNLFLMLNCYGCCPLTSEQSASKEIRNYALMHDDVSFIEVGTEGVYASTDSGKSWSYRGLYCSGLSALEVSDTYLFAGTFGGGVYLSTNNGAIWTEINEGLMNIAVRSLAISSTNLFAGTYGGGIWRRPLSEMMPMSTIEIADGWNMVSVPLTVGNCAKSSLFPTAVSSAYTFDSSGYAARDPLENGPGYFLKFNGLQSVTMTGLLRQSDTIGVRTGWNLIGSISAPVATSTISSIPGGIVTSQFFSYDGAYDSTDTIQPGNAYWVRVSQNAQLIISSSSAPSSPGRIRIVTTAEQPPPPPDGIVSQVREGIPTEFAVKQNYPNPFNPATEIGFQIPDYSARGGSASGGGFVSLRVYDVLGREVATLVSEVKEPGTYAVQWDASGVSSGVYFYRLKAGDFVQTKRMLLMR